MSRVRIPSPALHLFFGRQDIDPCFGEYLRPVAAVDASDVDRASEHRGEFLWREDLIRRSLIHKPALLHQQHALRARRQFLDVVGGRDYGRGIARCVYPRRRSRRNPPGVRPCFRLNSLQKCWKDWKPEASATSCSGSSVSPSRAAAWSSRSERQKPAGVRPSSASNARSSFCFETLSRLAKPCTVNGLAKEACICDSASAISGCWLTTVPVDRRRTIPRGGITIG